jgi:hypothetical protein
LVQGLANGEPPYTEQEEEENHIQTNINFKEHAQLILQAREQLENGLLSAGSFFTVTVPDAPAGKRDAYGAAITLRINRLLKKSRPFLHTMRSKLGSVALYGVGPQAWPDQYNPIPFFIPIEDLMIPTDTDITLEDLTYFAARRKMTPGSLFRKTFARGKNVDPGWNLKAVKTILNDYKDLNQNINNWNWAEHPEKMTELYKQNAVYYDSDAAPAIWFWDFYYQKEKRRGIGSSFWTMIAFRAGWGIRLSQSRSSITRNSRLPRNWTISCTSSLATATTSLRSCTTPFVDLATCSMTCAR